MAMKEEESKVKAWESYPSTRFGLGNTPGSRSMKLLLKFTAATIMWKDPMQCMPWSVGSRYAAQIAEIGTRVTASQV